MNEIDLRNHPTFAHAGNRNLRIALLEIVAGREDTTLTRQQAYEARKSAKKCGWGQHLVDHVKKGKRRFLWLPTGSLVVTVDGRRIAPADAEAWLGGAIQTQLDPEVYRRILADLNNWRPIFDWIRRDPGTDAQPLKIQSPAALETQIVGAILSLHADPEAPFEVLETNLRQSALSDVTEYVVDQRQLLVAKNRAIHDDVEGLSAGPEINLGLAKSPSLLALNTHVGCLNHLRSLRLQYLNKRPVTLGETSRLMGGLCRALCFAAIGKRLAHAGEVALHLASTRIELGVQGLLPLHEQDIADSLGWFEMLFQMRRWMPESLQAALVLRTAITLRRLGPSRAGRANKLHGFVIKHLESTKDFVPHGIVFCEAVRYGCVFGAGRAIISFPQKFDSPPVLLEYHLSKAAHEVLLAEQSNDEMRVDAARKFRRVLTASDAGDMGKTKWINRLQGYLKGDRAPGIAMAYPLVETLGKRA